MARILAMLAIFTVAAVPARAHAFARTPASSSGGPCIYWPQRTVHYVINEKGVSTLDFDTTRAAIEGGFGAWTGWECSDFSYVDDGTTPDVQVGYDRVLVSQPTLSGDVQNEHLVVFRERLCSDVVPADDDCTDPANDDCDNKYDCWADRADSSGDAIAYTLVTSETSTGRILDADTAFDALDFEFKDLATGSCDGTVDSAHCADVQNTMAHEAGHFLGLAHTDVTDATMYFQVNSENETSKRDLTDDDLTGLCTIYPLGKPPLSCVAPRPLELEGQGCGCSASRSTPPWTVLAAAVALLVAKRRRTH